MNPECHEIIGQNALAFQSSQDAPAGFPEDHTDVRTKSSALPHTFAASPEEADNPRRQDHSYHPGEENAVKDPRPSYGED